MDPLKKSAKLFFLKIRGDTKKNCGNILFLSHLIILVGHLVAD